MSIKDLLVAYQGDAGSRNALAFALEVAEKYGAALTGVHVQAPRQHVSPLETWIEQHVREIDGQDVGEIARKAEAEAAARIEAAFREQVGNGAQAPREWLSLSGPPDVLLARASRFHDFLITGQFEGSIRHGGRAVQPETILRRAGKPVVIVPQNYQVRPFRDAAVVAWDGSASAARALSDAMRILQTKKRLDVVSVQCDGDRIGPLTDHDIIRYLKRHDIDARLVTLRSEDGNVGRTILDYCAEYDPDVLIMGAFGRGKLGDLLFGGVSRYVLENQTVPVMMAH